MSNILDNGTVLPSGLLGQQGHESFIMAFNKSYRNTGIKAGIIVKSYAPDDPNNQNGLCQEYDVQTVEQQENKGSTSIMYRNCLSSQGFGGLADYFEYTLRAKTFQTNKGTPTFGDQDGAVVMIQCLDNIGDKAVVTGCLIHPDRETTITSNAPQLSGEYNGVNIQIANDGSCSLTFKGATDSKGIPTDPSQGNTVFQIQADGTFEFTNSNVTITGSKSGSLTVNTTADTNVNVAGNTNIQTQGTANIIAQGVTTIDGTEIKLGQNAQEAIILGDTFKKYLDQTFIVKTIVGPSGTSIIPVPPTALSKKSKTE